MVDEALSEGGAAPGSPPPREAAGAGDTGEGNRLTAREREVVALVAAGRTNRQIAEELVIARPTADRHVANILKKLDLHNRAQVAAWATARGLGAERSTR
ncbi:MAG TPA: helix-turn-helix transcriptional regulator, partial [Chloroflexota bacterium]|nr:helix-turn-helix transcriptional regulator [Chloroflexota bacterium]